MDPLVLAEGTAIVLLVGAMLVVRRWLSGRRREAMAAYARSAELSFLPSYPSLGRLPIAGLPLFRSGRKRSFRNVLLGSREVGRMMVFDLHHRVRTTALSAFEHDSVFGDAAEGARLSQKPRMRALTVVAFQSEGEWIAPFSIRGCHAQAGWVPEHAVAQLSGLPGEIRAEGSGEWVIIYRDDHCVPIDELGEFIGAACRFMEAIAGEPEGKTSSAGSMMGVMGTV